MNMHVESPQEGVQAISSYDGVASRRRFLIGSALASAAAVTPLAAMAIPINPTDESSELKLLVIELDRANTRYATACSAQRVVVEAVNEWREANPEPAYNDENCAAFAAAYSAWITQRNAFWREKGLAKVKTETIDAHHERVMAARPVADFEAVTFVDVRAKAQAALDYDPDGGIAESICYDLMALRV